MTILFILLGVVYPVGAQPTVDSVRMLQTIGRHIQYVGQFPLKENGSHQGILGKAGNFLFGEKVPLIGRPVNIIASGPSVFWFIDQGSGYLIKVRDNKASIPPAIRRRNESFPSLVGLCSLPGKGILFTDSRLNKIFLLDQKGKVLKPFSDTSALQQPTGIAYSASTQQVWVSESAAHRITILNIKGEIIKRIGKRGNAPGEFNYPTYLWIDANGDAYVVDCLNDRVQIFDKDGNYKAGFGEIGDATGFFSRPKGIAVDSHGNIYVADALMHNVQVFDRSGRFLSYFGKQGQGEGEFWMPGGIFIDDHDYLYVADTFNSRIQIFKLTDASP